MTQFLRRLLIIGGGLLCRKQKALSRACGDCSCGELKPVATAGALQDTVFYQIRVVLTYGVHLPPL